MNPLFFQVDGYVDLAWEMANFSLFGLLYIFSRIHLLLARSFWIYGVM